MKIFREIDNALVGEFQFSDFKQSLNFVLEVARISEEQNHHPDIDIRYDRVRLSLSTHDAGDTVTEKDYQLAKSIEEISEMK